MNLAVEYLKKQFKIFGITYTKDFVIIPMTKSLYTHDGYKYPPSVDLYKINFYPQKSLTNSQFSNISNYLKENFDMSKSDHYFTDQGDRFIIQVCLGNFYRNKILKDILDE